MKKREMLKHVMNGEVSDFKETFCKEIDLRIGKEASAIQDSIKTNLNSEAGDK